MPVRLTGGGGGGAGGATVDWGPDFGDGSDGTFAASPTVDLESLALAGNLSLAASLALPTVEVSGLASGTATASLDGSALGAPFVQSVSTFQSGAAVSTIPLAKPSGTATGDLLVAVLGINGAVTVTPGESGWTRINTNDSGAPVTRLATYWRIVAGGDPATYSFGLGTSAAAFGTLVRIIGFDTGTTIDVAGTATGSATDPVAPSITTTVANVLKIACCAQSNPAVNADYTPPAGYTEDSDLNGNGAGSALILTGEVAHRVQATAGASGTATMDSTQALASVYAAQHIAIRPGTVDLTP